MNDPHDQNTEASRRRFLIGGATSVAAGAAIAGLAACEGGTTGPSAQPAAAAHTPKTHVEPGQLDEYYGFWSGGQSGEIRVLGIPSMRELKRIPVFNADSATGWGKTDWSKQLLGGKLQGDTHHVHPSYANGTYDGRYIYVNDKLNARLARVRIATFEVDRITQIPNAQGTHGIFPQRHKTGYVFCNSEFHTPHPNDGRNLDDPKQYFALHTAIDGESMEVKWQVMVEGNMDLAAADYEGKYSFATCYNSEQGVTTEEMMAAERDYLYVFHIARIEEAVKAGKSKTIGQSPVPVVDGRGANNPLVLRIPVPKSPHGVNIDPTGRFAVVAGKLSPTVSVVDITMLDKAFAGEIEARATVVAEPEVGLGPLHTAFDGQGNAYTSIFIDSVMTKWNLDLAVRAFKGEAVEPVLEKVDVHYQVGHTNASMSETKEADGKWLVALCKFSKDRFLPVGPMRPENDQLIDLTGETLRIAHDGPTYPEPHDAVIVRKDLIQTIKIQDRTDDRFQMYEAWAKEDGVNLIGGNKVIRKGPNAVRVYVTSSAPNFGLREIRVKKGDTVQIICTNIDEVEDLTHGFSVCNHDVNFVITGKDTNSMTFTVPDAGVFWYYCSWFCHALHLEMRGRLIVEA